MEITGDAVMASQTSCTVNRATNISALVLIKLMYKDVPIRCGVDLKERENGEDKSVVEIQCY